MGGPAELKINPKKSRRRNLACYTEFLSVISCFKRTNLDDSKCRGEIKMLNECMSAATEKKKAHKSSLNFHLQRLSRAMKK